MSAFYTSSILGCSLSGIILSPKSSHFELNANGDLVLSNTNSISNSTIEVDAELSTNIAVHYSNVSPAK